jgi:hypothetical protein
MPSRRTSAVLAQRILEIINGDPGRMTKPVLLEERRQVIELCASQLGEKPKPIAYGRWDEDYTRAVRIVAGYDGANDFLRSLRDSLLQYGSLTVRQADAVLRPPSETEAAELKQMGVTGVEFSWQVREALREARKRDLATLREELDGAAR